MGSIIKLCFASMLAISSAYGPPSTAPPGHPNCLTYNQAYQVATLWTQLIGNYSQTLAQNALAAHYSDYSDSALTLNNVCPQAPVKSPPLLSPLFTNRTQFEIGQGMQKPIESRILQVWNDCQVVTMRWILTNTTNGGRPVAGIIALQTVPAPRGNPYPFLINTTYSEFDVGSWIMNLQDAGTCNSMAKRII